jgi:MFS family permease
MRLKTVPANQGLLWAQLGVRTFLRRPIAFAALLGAFVLAAFGAALVPFIGPLIGLAMLPLVTLGFMLASRIVIEGGVPTPMVYVVPLRAERSRVVSLLWLGAVYAAATFAALWISGIVDGGALAGLMQPVPDGQNPSDVVAKRLAEPGLLAGLALRLGLTGLLSVPFWHAPALVFWDGQRVAQSLFSSTLACWRNRGAFFVYALAWFAFVMMFGMAASLVFALVGSPEMFAVAGVPISLMITTVFYASLYFTFADSFTSNGDTAALPVTNPSGSSS